MMATGGWDPDDTDYMRSSTSLFMARPMTASNREATQKISEKARDLPDPVQKTFVRGMTSLCEQESETMLSFLADIRRSLHSTIDELRDEQEVLSSTASKISLTRLNSARRGSDLVYVPPPKPSAAPPQPRIEVRRLNDSATPRRGVRSARAQRIASARDRDRNSGRSSVETSMSSSSSSNPLNTISEYISTVAGGSRPTTSGSGDRSSLGSSMDSVTFETELTRVNSSNRRTSPRTPTSLTVPGLQVERARAEPPQKTTTVVFSAPKMLPPQQQQQSNTDDEYEEEKDEVMKQMSGIDSQIDKERERQKAMLRDRQERKKVKQGQNELLASEMVREASLLGEQKRKEKERQENLIRERLEERKKRKNEITVVVDVEDRKQSDSGNSTVFQVLESNSQLDTTKSSTKNGLKNGGKKDTSSHNEIIEIETQ